MSEDEFICPECGSRIVVQTPDGKLQCLNCGHKWVPEFPDFEEVEEENYEEDEDWEDENRDETGLFL